VGLASQADLLFRRRKPSGLWRETKSRMIEIGAIANKSARSGHKSDLPIAGVSPTRGVPAIAQRRSGRRRRVLLLSRIVTSVANVSHPNGPPSHSSGR